MFEKKVFISHSSKNKEIADHLCAFIARLGVKDENIFCSSVIGKGIDNGQQLNKAIADAITKSSLLIFILSCDFLSSSYCMEELGVGWFLAQRGDVACYYLVLPDIDMSDILGFVNSKVDKFTFLDINHVEDLSSLSCDLSKQLHFRMKSHNLITNAENVFLSSIKSLNEQLIEAKKTRKYLLELEENEKNELREEISKNVKTIESLNILLTQAKQRGAELDADIELRTIEKFFWSISYTDLVPTNPIQALEKDFWFDFVNRYDELCTQINALPSNSKAEKVISMVYLANGNPDIAYNHFMIHLKLKERSVNVYDLDFFAENYKGSLQEAIELLETYYASVKEGMRKDDLAEAIEYLTKREETLAL